MSTTFYKSIIDDEIKSFNIKGESLKNAAITVSKTYSRNSLNRGQTFLDYNNPSNRCAYIFKYASIHTSLVTKYFGKLIRKKETESSLQKKGILKICCLGGGPGSDIVGLFKVLARFPHYYKKVIEVTVLDICGGWRNSFKRIITDLISGKVKDVPETFINASDFKFQLIEVDLLHNLPSNIVAILSEADIVCMVKFVSAILGFSTSVSALQVIGDKLKLGAIVLFIDNFRGNVFKPLVDISHHVSLQLILGPVHQSFNKKTGYNKGPVTSKEKQMFGCLPLPGTAVTVLGFTKSDNISGNIHNTLIHTVPNSLLYSDSDESWDTDNDSEKIVTEISKKSFKCFSASCQDKFTQTDKKSFDDPNMSANTCVETVSAGVLYTLVERLCGLLTVLSKFKQQISVRNHSHHCH